MQRLTKVLFVRMSEEMFEAIEKEARGIEVGPSTFARSVLAQELTKRKGASAQQLDPPTLPQKAYGGVIS